MPRFVWFGLSVLAVGALVFPFISCSAFNPAFVDVALPPGSNFATIDNAPGHVVLQFVNNAEVDDRLLAYMESAEGGGLVLTDLEKATLHPRVRMRWIVTFTDGSVTGVEFVNGSKKLISPDFDTSSEPDLNQNDLDNAVVLCDVARVEPQPDATVDVFIPTPLQRYEIVEVENNNDNTVQLVPVLRETQAPQFSPLAVDTVDQDGNVIVRRNVGVRDVPSPINNVRCGSVITIEMKGVLSVPFLDAFAVEQPSYDQGDPSSVGSIGGRFEFIIGVQ